MRANSPTNSDIMTSPAPQAVIQKLIVEERKGDVASAGHRSGTTKFMSPVTRGIATKRIMMTPWAVKIWSCGAAADTPGIAEGDRLLRAHHDGIQKPQQHHHSN